MASPESGLPTDFDGNRTSTFQDRIAKFNVPESAPLRPQSLFSTSARSDCSARSYSRSGLVANRIPEYQVPRCGVSNPLDCRKVVEDRRMYGNRIPTISRHDASTIHTASVQQVSQTPRSKRSIDITPNDEQKDIKPVTAELPSAIISNLLTLRRKGDCPALSPPLALHGEQDTCPNVGSSTTGDSDNNDRAKDNASRAVPSSKPRCFDATGFGELHQTTGLGYDWQPRSDWERNTLPRNMLAAIDQNETRPIQGLAQPFEPSNAIPRSATAEIESCYPLRQGLTELTQDPAEARSQPRYAPEVLSEGAPPCHSTKKVPYESYGIESRGSPGASDDGSLEAISGLAVNKLDRIDSQTTVSRDPSIETERMSNKPKFTFKRRIVPSQTQDFRRGDMTPNTRASDEDGLTSGEVPFTEQRPPSPPSCNLTGLSNEYARIPSAGLCTEGAYSEISLNVAMMKECILDLCPRPLLPALQRRQSVAAIPQRCVAFHGRDIRDSIVVISPHITGSILLSNVEDSLIVASCQQFRMFQSKRCVVLLNSHSRPSIEKSSDIRFGNYPYELAEEDTRQLTRNIEVQDFDWLDGTPSPNWSRHAGIRWPFATLSHATSLPYTRNNVLKTYLSKSDPCVHRSRGANGIDNPDLGEKSGWANVLTTRLKYT